MLPAFGVIPALPDHLQFWLLMALGALVFVPATLLTQPEDMDRLVRYYVMTRPLGWWGPVRAEAARRGLLAGHEDFSPVARRDQAGAGAAARAQRPFIRRSWDAVAANEWSREDWIAIVLSPTAFACILMGLTKLLLLQWSGLWLVALAVVCVGVAYWVIDPKLRAVSSDYEQRQARYLDEAETRLRVASVQPERGDV